MAVGVHRGHFVEPLRHAVLVWDPGRWRHGCPGRRLFGIPSLRIKGLYLAIATLAAQLIIEWTINHVHWIGGGAQSSIYVNTPSFFGLALNNEFRRYYLILVFFLLAYFAAQNLVRSRVGRAFIAIRDRDVAAQRSLA